MTTTAKSNRDVFDIALVYRAKTYFDAVAVELPKKAKRVALASKFRANFVAEMMRRGDVKSWYAIQFDGERLVDKFGNKRFELSNEALALLHKLFVFVERKIGDGVVRLHAHGMRA